MQVEKILNQLLALFIGTIQYIVVGNKEQYRIGLRTRLQVEKILNPIVGPILLGLKKEQYRIGLRTRLQVEKTLNPIVGPILLGLKKEQYRIGLRTRLQVEKILNQLLALYCWG
jgi:acetyl/propionyl-CoA carboxylase alpha subunit